MKPQGGTELLYNNLIKYVGTDWQKNVNLVLSFCHQGILNPNKTNVLWQHLHTDQGAIRGMQDRTFIDSVDHFVYVSNWQLQQYRTRFDISDADNRVIKNAIEPIEFLEKPKDRLRLIYTSMPNRGLSVLLDAFPLLNRDVELVIYSSNIIYGKSYYDMMGTSHEPLFNRARTMKNVSYKGFAANKAVRLALQQSHILAYPSTFEETSCIAAIEAGAAGCQIVTTDLGALPETCGQWAQFTEYTPDHASLVDAYVQMLRTAVDNYTPDSVQLAEQSQWFNNEYSWNNRAKEWGTFLNGL